MPIITFDDFAGGLDVRPAAALSKTNILRVLTNAYVTTGKSIKKRPCLEKIATLEAGTVGLKAFGGKLNTFYGAAPVITHADTRFVARRLPHWTSGAAPTKIHYCDQYNALMYACAEYAGGVFRHHYLDDPGAWAAATSYTIGAYRRPITANGFRYEMTAGADPGAWAEGTSYTKGDYRRPTVTNGLRYEMTGGADPGAWATATAYVVGNFRRPTVANGFRYEVTAIAGTGTSGAAEPTWPTTIGQTVIDNPGANQVVWTCRALIGTSTADPGAWAAVTAYPVATYRRPVVKNGFRYEVTAILGTGTSGAAEPTWPTTIGATVIDNPGANQITWTCRVGTEPVWPTTIGATVVDNQVTWACRAIAGTSGGAEPAWPTTVGVAIVDNQVTWTCRTFAVTDANCPHTKQVTKQAQKMYAAGAGDNTTVRYCKTGEPRDWSAVNDAGFIAAGLYARGSDRVTAIGPFQKSGLWVGFSDNSQVWTVDANPANITLSDNIEGIGTLFHRAAGPVSRDLFFLAQNGFRSVSLISITDNLQDTDVGSAIDAIVTAGVLSTDDPLSLYYPKLGQFWSINGDMAWAYSFSRTSKISAWSKYTFPFDVDDVTVLNQELYLRTGNDVYKVNDAVYKDGVSSIPLIDVQMFAQDAKKPAVLKQFMGMDVIGIGQWTIGHVFYKEDGTTAETPGYEYQAITEPGNLGPVELLCTRIGPHLQHQKDEPAELSSLMLHYESLGPV